MNVPKRLTLVLCLIAQAQVQTRDDLVEMCIKRVHRIHVQGKEEMTAIHGRQQETTEHHPVANAAIFQNVVDMTYAIRDLIREGYPVTRAALAGLSPNLTRTIKRFGEYPVHLDVPPTPLDGEMALALQQPEEMRATLPA